MNKILCIGEALIDMICTDKNQTLSDGTNFLKKTGGAPTNVAAAIAALGGNVELAAKVGADPFGQQLIDEMKSFGVSTEWMIQSKDYFTTFAFVSLFENGERDFYFNRGADGQLSVEDISQLSLNDVSIVHFGSATGFLPGQLHEAYLYLLVQAKAENKFISFDPNYRQLLFQHNLPSFIQQSWNFIEQADFFKVSDEEALLLTGANNIDEAVNQLMERTSQVFAITVGKKGTMLRVGESVKVIPSIPVVAIDATGAGDAFVGAVLFQLSEMDATKTRKLNEEQWAQIVVNANKAGARTCEFMGAMEAFKHLSKEIFN